MSRDVFETICEYSPTTDCIRVGWVSRFYGERQCIELRRGWVGDGRSNADRLRLFIERLVGRVILDTHDVTRDARGTIRALLPVWEREIYHQMERIEREDLPLNRMFYSRPMDPTFWGTDWSSAEDPKAKDKARQLLMRNLDDGQLKSFKKDGWFKVTAKDGKAYTISTARSFNVKADDGTKYCGQLKDTPVEDQMLAQKLLLEHEPEKFFKNANVSPASIASDAMGFIQSGTGITATEIQMRMAEVMRTPRIMGWDSNI